MSLKKCNLCFKNYKILQIIKDCCLRMILIKGYFSPSLSACRMYESPAGGAARPALKPGRVDFFAQPWTWKQCWQLFAAGTQIWQHSTKTKVANHLTSQHFRRSIGVKKLNLQTSLPLKDCTQLLWITWKSLKDMVVKS